MNWRALLDVFPRKMDSLSDAKRRAWKVEPGDGIRPPRRVDPKPAAMRVVVNRWEIVAPTELEPLLMHGPQFDECGEWKRH
jgi:hypothetical protein